MPTARLWTFQRSFVTEQLDGDNLFVAAWDSTPQNWRRGYVWMARCLEQRTHSKLSGAPIWCWHSCNGKLGAPPTVWTARALLCDYELEQGVKLVTLQVPDEFMLLSSYWAWNEFLDFVIVNQALPRNRRWRQRMFQSPLLKHDTDDIQAVLPFIRRDWVENVRPIFVSGRGGDETL